MNERSFLFYTAWEICQEQKDPNYGFGRLQMSARRNLELSKPKW
jgi:hypothetical protein